MRLTIVVDDKLVGVDGIFYKTDLTGLPADVRAVQFNGTKGHVEFNDGKPNEAITSIAAYQPFIDNWQATHDIITAPPTLPEVKANKLAQLQRSRDAAEQADVTVQGKQFSAGKDIADRFEKLSSRLRRSKPTALAAIFTTDGTPVNPVTAQLLEQIEDAIAAQGEAAWNKYGQLVGQVMAATTVEQVNAIVW